MYRPAPSFRAPRGERPAPPPGVLGLTLAGLVVLLAGRTRALREQGLRTREALVTTAAGD